MRATSVVSSLRTTQLAAGKGTQELSPVAVVMFAARSSYIARRYSTPTDQFRPKANSTPAPITPPQTTPPRLAVTPVGAPNVGLSGALSNSTTLCARSAQAAPPVT